MEYFVYALNHTYTDDYHTNSKFWGIFDCLVFPMILI